MEIKKYSLPVIALLTTFPTSAMARDFTVVVDEGSVDKIFEFIIWFVVGSVVGCLVIAVWMKFVPNLWWSFGVRRDLKKLDKQSLKEKQDIADAWDNIREILLKREAEKVAKKGKEVKSE